MNKRQKGWTAAFLSGGCGWYLALASAKVVPPLGIWWVESFLGLAAVATWLYSTTVVIQDMDWLVKKLATPDHYLRCDLIRKREERLAKWLLIPLLIWWLPLLMAFAGGLVND